MTVVYFSKVDGLAKFGDYSPVAAAGEFVYIAGQFGTDSNAELPDGDGAAEQIRGSFANVGTALAAAGLGFEDVVSFKTFLVGRETIPSFMDVRKQVFADIYPSGQYPPNTLLLVAGLVEERFVAEIEAIAYRPAGR